MKKIIYLSLSLVLAFTFSKAQTAVDFTANDCSSTSHTLFTELDAGKTIVMVFVMPCSMCVSGAQNAQNAVAQEANPDVLFYIFDDAGNNNCSSLTSWESSNSVTPTQTFDNSGATNPQTNYGSGGMPKIVVVGGGTSHHTYLAVNGSSSVANIKSAIDNSLSSIAGVNSVSTIATNMNVFPNPSNGNAELNFSLIKNTKVTVEMFNTLGEKLISNSVGAMNAGTHSVALNTTELAEGIYFVRLNANGETTEVKFSVIK